MSSDLLLRELVPILAVLANVDLSRPTDAAKDLNLSLSPGTPAIQRVRYLFEQGLERGWLCEREAGDVRFGRLTKPSAETNNFSIDAVSMRGPGVWHRHTKGEIDLCFASEGAPTFDGHPEGWVVFAPGSEHIPTVSDGTMNILYFLPDGAIDWKR